MPGNGQGHEGLRTIGKVEEGEDEDCSGDESFHVVAPVLVGTKQRRNKDLRTKTKKPPSLAVVVRTVGRPLYQGRRPLLNPICCAEPATPLAVPLGSPDAIGIASSNHIHSGQRAIRGSAVQTSSYPHG